MNKKWPVFTIPHHDVSRPRPPMYLLVQRSPSGIRTYEHVCMEGTMDRILHVLVADLIDSPPGLSGSWGIVGPSTSASCAERRQEQSSAEWKRR